VRPTSVIDVGAAYGDWSIMCQAVFPSARYLLVEPLEEFAPFLHDAVARLSDANWVPAVAAGQRGERNLRVHRDLVGSSLLVEAQESDDVETRVVSAAAVDELVRDHDAAGPYLLKVDAQGGELEVLRGAQDTLRQTELVILEVTFLPLLIDGPEFADVVSVMAASGFVMHDILDLSYRPLDGALAQADAMFVPASSPLRTEVGWASPNDQRRLEADFRGAYEKRRRQLGGAATH
jgi:FkbM family methyltransferase